MIMHTSSYIFIIICVRENYTSIIYDIYLYYKLGTNTISLSIAAIIICLFYFSFRFSNLKIKKIAILNEFSASMTSKSGLKR